MFNQHTEKPDDGGEANSDNDDRKGGHTRGARARADGVDGVLLVDEAGSRLGRGRQDTAPLLAQRWIDLRRSTTTLAPSGQGGRR